MGSGQRRPTGSSAGRKAGIVIGLVALGLVAAFALAQARPGTAGVSSGQGAVSSSDAARAPDLTVSLLGGGTFELSRERGHPVLVLFTASWCASCIPEVNKMAQLNDEYVARGLRQVVVSVDPGDTADDFALLRDRTRGQRLMWALDDSQRATRAYRITATDTKVLIDPAGRIAFTSIGPTDLGVLRAEVERALR